MQSTTSLRPYRLALDLGSTSLGWAVLDLDKHGNLCGIRKIGARLFSDGRNPKDKTSLAVVRRVARQMRRRRDRYLYRRQRLLAALIRHGLMPADATARKALAQRDPYELRQRGVEAALSLHEFGRVLFHLNQRRGYAANRKTAKRDENESGKIKAGTAALAADLQARGAATLGAFLAWRLSQRKTVRARLEGVGAKAFYPFYPGRDMLAAEFETLWREQARHYPDVLTAAVRDDLHQRIFHQRPLKPVPVGKCTFFPDEARAPRALPSAQLFRLYTELANLRLVYPDRSEQALTPPQRDTVLNEIRKKARKSLTWVRIRQLLKLGSEVEFNLASDRQQEFRGDETGARLAADKCFGKRWFTFTLAEQDEIVTLLLEEENEEKLIGRLTGRWQLAPENAVAVAETRLPDFHASIGRRALAMLLPVLASETEMDPETRLPRCIRYDEAVARVGLHHADLRPGALLDRLPYYGAVLERHVAFGTREPAHEEEKRLGRIANPTVHVGLNQLRHLVNDVMARYGRPAEIVVELARDIKYSAEEKKKKEREQADNQKRNDAWREEIKAAGFPDNGHNMAKIRIWSEQKAGGVAVCPYTGTVIGLRMLLSEAVDIDHILPFSKSLDDSIANKVVCLREANRQKRNRTPWQAFGPDGPYGSAERWAAILARVEDLPKNKRWRFAPDALAKFDAAGGFEARQLNDTRYLSRVAREYLQHVCGGVRASPGRLTALLRVRWGLNTLLNDHNRKNRDDHRHHAIDAVVIGCIDQSLVQRVARARGLEEEEGLDRFLKDCREPWDGLRDQLSERLDKLVVSHRPEHGTNGRMHEDTAYGFIDPAENDGFNLVRRKLASDLSENDVAAIRDRDLSRALTVAIKSYREREKLDYKAALPKALADIRATARWHDLRHVRVMVKESRPIPIYSPEESQKPVDERKPYKGLVAGEIHHIDIFADLSAKGRWTGTAATLFEAQRSAQRDSDGNKTDVAVPPRPEPGKRFVMRLHKGDYLRLEHEGRERLMLVIKLEPSINRVVVIEPHRAKQDRSLHTGIAYDQLRKRRARRVTVSRLGAVRDPGFRESPLPEAGS